MAKLITKPRDRVFIGMLGGFTPVLLNLAVIDSQTVFNDFTWPAAFGYLVKVLALVTIGGLVAWLHEEEKRGYKVFEIGLAAPAVVAGLLNASALRVDSASGTARLDLATPAYAAQQVSAFEVPKETVTQQVFRGLLGIRAPLREWVVEVHDDEDRGKAVEELRSLQERFPGFEFKLFAPSAGVDEYVVTIGGQVTEGEAFRIRREAQQGGVPGVELRLIPREGRAEVHIYREYEAMGTRKSIFVDGLEVARVPNERFFSIRLTPGRSSFVADNLNEDEFLLSLEPGQVYYLRMKSTWLHGEELEEVEPAKAREDIEALTLIPPELIFDRDRVFIAEWAR